VELDRTGGYFGGASDITALIWVTFVPSSRCDKCHAEIASKSRGDRFEHHAVGHDSVACVAGQVTHFFLEQQPRGPQRTRSNRAR
jgi:hypothetical protein